MRSHATRPQFLRAIETVTAADGNGAAGILSDQTAECDLLFVWVLPCNLSGFDVISVVTREKPRFKIMAASGVYGNSVLGYISKNLGADAYVEKTKPGEGFKSTDCV